MKDAIICEKCGAEVPKRVNFCPFCGANLKILKKGWAKEQNETSKVPSNLTQLNLNEKLLSAYETVAEQLDDLDEIDLAYEQHQRYLHHLEEQYQHAKKRYKHLKKKAQKEKDDVEKLKNISWTSIKARISGDKDKKIKKEEAEYLDALNEKEAAKTDYKELKEKREMAQEEMEDLVYLKGRKEDLQEAMANILDKVCKGVPDPVEDRIEEVLAGLQNQMKQMAHERNKLKDARSHLLTARDNLQNALKNLGGAKGFANWDTFFGGGLLVDAMKRSKMSNARDFLQRGKNAISRAYHAVPNLPRISNADVRQLNFMWDTFFDNIFSDFNARNKILQSREEVKRVLSDIEYAINWVHQELSGESSHFQNLQTQITQTKKKLVKERRRMIEEALET